MTSYVFLAPGFEEVEAITPVDVMRRAGMDVKTAAVAPTNEVAGAHGVKYVADVNIADVDLTEAEWLICPGGLPGASNLHADAKLSEALKTQHARGGKIAAICASPAVVLYPLGILDGRKATCYPGFENDCADAEMTGERVVALDNLITANGPASSLLFALAIVANSMGANVADEVAKGMLYK